MAKHQIITFTEKELSDIIDGIDCLEAMGDQDAFNNAVKSFDKALKRAGLKRKKDFEKVTSIPNTTPNRY